MGIARFVNVWLRKRYGNVIQKQLPSNISSLLIDCNGIIHKASQIVFSYGKSYTDERIKIVNDTPYDQLETEVFAVVTIIILEIINMIKPKHTLVIAIDGVAPMAKIMQQRSRRFKSALDMEVSTANTLMVNSNLNRNGNGNGNGDENENRNETKPKEGSNEISLLHKFDTCSITPGTEFMRKLDQYLQNWIKSEANKLPPKVIYSSHLVPGEGEHKIMDMIRNNEIMGSDAHVLYGLDADLIMLALLAPINQMYLMRENIRDIINVDYLRQELLEEMKLSTALDDFVIMIYLLGNDFLPHAPALEDFSKTIDLMIDRYKSLNISLTKITNNIKEIDFNNLQLFLTKLAEDEPNLMEQEAFRPNKIPSKMVNMATTTIQISGIRFSGSMKELSVGQQQKLFNFDKFREAWYDNEFELRYKIEDNDTFKSNVNKVMEMIDEYLIGLAWVYMYYTSGLSYINMRWYYKYYHAPLIVDIKNIPKDLKMTKHLRIPDQPEFSSIHQLLSVLPISSKNLLPEEAQTLMEPLSIISDYYPVKFIVELDGKEAEWQGIPILPFIDPDRIIEAVDSIDLSEDQLELYNNGSNIMIVRDNELTGVISAKSELVKRNISVPMSKYSSKNMSSRNSNHSTHSTTNGNGHTSKQSFMKPKISNTDSISILSKGNQNPISKEDRILKWKAMLPLM